MAKNVKNSKTPNALNTKTVHYSSKNKRQN